MGSFTDRKTESLNAWVTYSWSYRFVILDLQSHWKVSFWKEHLTWCSILHELHFEKSDSYFQDETAGWVMGKFYLLFTYPLGAINVSHLKSATLKCVRLLKKCGGGGVLPSQKNTSIFLICFPFEWRWLAWWLRAWIL